MTQNGQGVSRPPVRYHGGKWRIANWIIDQFPRQYECYVEPFCGGASVLLRRPSVQAQLEAIADRVRAIEARLASMGQGEGER